VDVPTVVVASAKNSVLVRLIVFIIVSSVGISIDEDKDEYSVELRTFSFIVEIEFNKDSE
jgi:hypothetical protein